MKNAKFWDLTIKFIRFFRRLWVATWILVTLVGLGAGFPAILDLKGPEWQILNIVMIYAVFVLIIALAFYAVFLMPTYKIYFFLEKLLLRARLSPNEFLDQSKEYLKLKRYLIIQFFLNIFIGVISELASSKYAHTPESVHTAILNDPVFLRFDRVFEIFSYLDWIYPSLNKSMPIYLLSILILVLHIQRENLVMRKELEEVL